VKPGIDCLHIVWLIPLPSQNAISRLIKIGNGFTFLVPVYLGCTGKQADKLVLFVIIAVVVELVIVVVAQSRHLLPVHISQTRPGKSAESVPAWSGSLCARLVPPGRR